MTEREYLLKASFLEKVCDDAYQRGFKHGSDSVKHEQQQYDDRQRLLRDIRDAAAASQRIASAT